MRSTFQDILPELRHAITVAVRSEIRAALSASPHTAPIFLTVRQAMDVLNLSRTEFYRRVQAGDLAIVKRGRRSLICSEAVRRYAERLRVGAP
jgi:excisionase family DNA binding protein